MPFDTSTMGNFLKRVYEKRSQSLLVNKWQFHELVKSKQKTFIGGEALYGSIKTARNNGVGARPRVNELLPVSGNSTHTPIVVSPYDVYARMRISKRLRALAKTDTAAFGEAAVEAIDDTAEAFAEDHARMTFGDGTGVIALLNGVVGAGTEVVDSPLNYKDGANNPLLQGTHALRDGWRLSVGTNGELTAGGNTDVTISTTAPSTSSVTFSAVPAGIADNDILARGTGTTTSDQAYLNEPAGLLAAVDDRDPANWGVVTAAGRWASGYLGVLRSAVPLWGATRDHNSGVSREFSSMLVHDMVRRIKSRSGDQPTHFVCNPMLEQAIIAEISPDMRYAPQEVKAGYSSLTFSSGKPLTLVPDDWCPVPVGLILNMDTFERWTLEEPHWEIGGDGSQLHWIENTNSEQGYMWSSFEFVCKKPSANGKIEDLDVIGDYSW